MYPLGALAVGGIAGAIFVYVHAGHRTSGRSMTCWRLAAARAVQGAGGGIAAGILAAKALGGIGGVALASQLVGTLIGIVIAVFGAAIVYGSIGISLACASMPKEEYNGADLTIHKISATPGWIRGLICALIQRALRNL